MSTWRLWGVLSQAKTREETRAQLLDGWSPWQQLWNRCDELGIVIPDPEDSKRFLHAPTYWVERDGKTMKFAVHNLESGGWRFFLPAVSSQEGAFEARAAQCEGFWRSSPDADEDLPWPQPEPDWSQRADFLDMLSRAESDAERVAYRGYSQCRLCGCTNGSESFLLDVWEWPSGFRHYIAEHEVRPSPDFESFVQEYVDSVKRL